MHTATAATARTGLAVALRATLRGPRIWLLIPALSTSGCGALQYYSQSVAGQIDLYRRSRPIEEVLRDPSLPEEMRRGLQRVQEIRAFAVAEMRLPDNGSYRNFARLDRPFVVWNVFAAPELSLTPKTWCFPIAGCLTYRGYFDEARAREYADTLRRSGMDVYVGGVAAYSTLGWLHDPVLDTMLHGSAAELARLLLHELAHQKLYVRGDPEFNEGFAESVARIGVERWLAGRPDAEAARYRAEQARDDAFFALMREAREALARIYSGGDDAARRAGKTALGDELRRRYREVSRGWDKPDAYSEWFDGQVNNARIAAVSTYRDLVPDFLRVYDAGGRDLDAFYDRISKLGGCSAEARRRWLRSARIDDAC